MNYSLDMSIVFLAVHCWLFIDFPFFSFPFLLNHISLSACVSDVNCRLWLLKTSISMDINKQVNLDSYNAVCIKYNCKIGSTMLYQTACMLLDRIYCYCNDLNSTVMELHRHLLCRTVVDCNFIWYCCIQQSWSSGTVTCPHGRTHVSNFMY